MERRDFLTAAAAGIGALPVGAVAQSGRASGQGPALLTITGAIGRGNRGPLDPALDQMMVKQKITFTKAYALDFAAVTALPAVSIEPTLEYDSKAHRLSGPLLASVVESVGGPAAGGTTLLLRAVDGYAVAISMADAREYRYIVATHLDRQPMPLGGLGAAVGGLRRRPLSRRRRETDPPALRGLPIGALSCRRAVRVVPPRVNECGRAQIFRWLVTSSAQPRRSRN